MISKFYSEVMAEIYCGHALEVLKSLPKESVQLAVTSPPYWGLRNYSGGSDIIWGGDENCDHIFEGSEYHEHRAEQIIAGKSRTTERFYGEPSRKFNNDVQRHYSNVFCVKCQGWKGQLGLEPTPELYVEHLLMIFREVKRVLKKSGSFWLNISDTYSATRSYQVPQTKWQSSEQGVAGIPMKSPLQPKCMVCIPERVMFAMLEDGWILRNKNIWRKPNALPGSQKDRFTTSWEYLYFFVKNNKTCLWRNRETGEWRDTRPTKQENYPWGGIYQNPETGEFSWVKQEGWLKLQPLFMGFDYYFELDAVREPHKTQSLERYQRQVNFGDKTPDSKFANTSPYPEGMQAMYRDGRNLCPQWFKEMFPEDKDYKGKFDLMFERGSNTGEHNKEPYQDNNPHRIRLEQAKKDEQYRRRDTQHQITPTDAPNRSSVDWRAEAAKKGQFFDNPVAHQGGGNTELGKHHGASHDGRAGFDREMRDRPLVAPHHRDSGDGWEKQAIEGREPKIKHDIAVNRTGNVAYSDPLHTRDYSPKGKNPGDILTTEGYQGKSHRFGKKSHGGQKRNLIPPEDGPELHAFHPKGKNPGDIVSAMTVRHKSWMSTPGHPYTHKATGKPQNPGDYWEITTQPTRVKHYAAFPEKLCERPILASSRVGDIVLDPLAGTGTTGVVAKRFGRKAILIDVAPDYCEYAKERISKAEYQIPLTKQ